MEDYRELVTSLKSLVLRTVPPSVAGSLRSWHVKRLIAKYPARIVEHQYGDVRLRVQLADPLSEGWYDHDWVQLPEIPALRGRSLRPGAKVFDLGAHQGIVALMLAHEVGPAGQVVAVEANPHNAAAALRNVALNGGSRIELLQRAAADRPGRVSFNQGLNGQLDDGSGSGGRVSVESVTLDDLAHRYGMPDVVFIDVEGAECLVLEGGQRVLGAGADFAVEVHVNAGLEKLGGSVERLLAHFPSSRFTLLARSEGDEGFRALVPDDRLISGRFFLLALRS